MRTLTERGFVVYDQFEDKYGTQVRVQQSSAASEPCVWIFANEQGKKGYGAAHLTIEQAKRIRNALDDFVQEHQ